MKELKQTMFFENRAKSGGLTPLTSRGRQSSTDRTAAANIRILQLLNVQNVPIRFELELRI